jgi:hypothetical protein
MQKLQMNSIKHHREGHLRRILIFQSIKATAEPFTLASGAFLTRCVYATENPQTIGFPEYFQYSHRTFNHGSRIFFPVLKLVVFESDRSFDMHFR